MDRARVQRWKKLIKEQDFSVIVTQSGQANRVTQADAAKNL